MFLPAGLELTGPLPPGESAARLLAAVIRPPRLIFAMCSPRLCVPLIVDVFVVDLFY